MIPDHYEFEKVYSGSVEDLQEELRTLTIENINKFPSYRTKWDYFYSMWQKFGPDAARTILIPYIWDGRFPSPLEACT